MPNKNTQVKSWWKPCTSYSKLPGQARTLCAINSPLLNHGTGSTRRPFQMNLTEGMTVSTWMRCHCNLWKHRALPQRVVRFKDRNANVVRSLMVHTEHSSSQHS